MGDHSAESTTMTKLQGAVSWVIRNRRKVLSAVVVLVPLVARVIPDFPAETVLDFLRMYFGA